MQYRNLGKWGLKLSEVALGSWVTDLSGTAAEEVALQTVRTAFDLGVNFFDCADAYSGGAAERFLGKANIPAMNSSSPPRCSSPWDEARTIGGSPASTSKNSSKSRSKT